MCFPVKLQQSPLKLQQTYFEEHLPTTSSEWKTKVHWLYKENRYPTADDAFEQQIFCIANVNFMKLVSVIFTLYPNVFCYFIWDSESEWSDKNHDNILKCFDPAIVVEQF